jgi:hypothetical protein
VKLIILQRGGRSNTSCCTGLAGKASGRRMFSGIWRETVSNVSCPLRTDLKLIVLQSFALW